MREGLGISSAGELLERFDGLPAWLDERIESELLGEEVPDYTGHPKQAYATFTPDDAMWWQGQLMGNSEGFKDRLALVGLRLACATISPQRFWELAKQSDWSESLQPSKLRAQFRQTALNSFSDQMLPAAMLYQELKWALLNMQS